MRHPLKPLCKAPLKRQAKLPTSGGVALNFSHFGLCRHCPNFFSVRPEKMCLSRLTLTHREREREREREKEREVSVPQGSSGGGGRGLILRPSPSPSLPPLGASIVRTDVLIKTGSVKKSRGREMRERMVGWSTIALKGRDCDSAWYHAMCHFQTWL